MFAQSIFDGNAGEADRGEKQDAPRRNGNVQPSLASAGSTTGGKLNDEKLHLVLRRSRLAGAGALLTAAPAAAQGKKVCYAFQDLSTGFWGAGHEAIVSTLQKNGIEVVELNGGKDANRQLEQIKDCIAQGADGIILTADDGDSETMLVALAQEADVPIATFNRPPSDMSKGIIVVADNESVARLAVEAMAVLGEGNSKAPARSCIR